jgi:acyl carrier protein
MRESAAPATREVDVEELRELIAEVIDVDVAEVSDDASFAEELEVDSLLALEIVVRLEKRYGVKMADDELSSVRSLRTTRDLLARKMVAG